MFSETRYALNGDLRVAYRASREGPRDIVYIPNWFTNCEVGPELPSIQGWIEAMTSARSAHLLRPTGHGSLRSGHAGRAANLGTMGRQHHRGVRPSWEPRSGPSREHRRVGDGCAVRVNTSVPAPSRLSCSRATQIRLLNTLCVPAENPGRTPSLPCGARGEWQHTMNPDMPWNEEIRATWARDGTPGGQPADPSLS